MLEVRKIKEIFDNRLILKLIKKSNNKTEKIKKIIDNNKKNFKGFNATVTSKTYCNVLSESRKILTLDVFCSPSLYRYLIGW